MTDRLVLVLMAVVCTVALVLALLGATWVVDRLTEKVAAHVEEHTNASSATDGQLGQLSWRSATAIDVSTDSRPAPAGPVSSFSG